jgi:hypothetical protein
MPRERLWSNQQESLMICSVHFTKDPQKSVKLSAGLPQAAYTVTDLRITKMVVQMGRS